MTTLPPSGNTAKTHPENRAFFPALDGLRAIAFVMVFAQHYLALDFGWTGVNVFFVLSGFLITGILFDTRDDPHRVRNFYVRRSLRIFPLFYGIAAVLLLLWPAFHWRWDRYWLLWPLYLGNFLRFLSPASAITGSALQLAADAQLRSVRLPHSEVYLGHLWSLCVEEQFYLVWPWLVFWVKDRRRLIAICTAAVIVGPLFRVTLQHLSPAWMLQRELLYRFTPAQADALLLGGLLALLWRGPAKALLLRWAQAFAALGTLVLAIFLVLWFRGQVGGNISHWIYTWGLLFADLYSAAILVCALRPGGWLYTVLRVRPLREIGRLSYGAYVYHDLLHGLYVHLVVHLGGPGVAADTYQRRYETALLAFPATMLLAWVSFRVFESPFLNLKDRWTIPAVSPGRISADTKGMAPV